MESDNHSTSKSVDSQHVVLRLEGAKIITHNFKKMTLKDMQKAVDQWIKSVGNGYFSELTNMALLTEETGELARVIARVYGDQKPKPGDLTDPKENLKEEIADVLWVLTCIANQTGIDLQEAFDATVAKKSKRDRNRFKSISKE